MPGDKEMINNLIDTYSNVLRMPKMLKKNLIIN